ncbi:MAG: hypothetical protein KC421_11840, partial [Anaerolineales bacterium]|nr:hypothetical protein [Anaerolineales bacterium]
NSSRTGFVVSLAYVSAAAVGLTLTAHWLVPFLFGAAYQPAAATLRLLAWSLVPFAFTLRFSFELVAQQQERTVLIVTLLTLVSTAVIATLATHTAGQTGTAAAVVTGETIQAVLLFVARQKTN